MLYVMKVAPDHLFRKKKNFVPGTNPVSEFAQLSALKKMEQICSDIFRRNFSAHLFRKIKKSFILHTNNSFLRKNHGKERQS
ncbi:hypothetical protein DD829_08530 [Chryseobacterium sp. HMWF035]|nr:hypothetical protein DBR25_12975 [Chryseobacterium sp. HMWF001]PVV57489.1 hypothetical protein DD829_08530 [Chryseobacterium sp. HMWF035]